MRNRSHIKWLVLALSAFGIVLGGMGQPGARERNLADKIGQDDPKRYPHQSMYAVNPGNWTVLDRQGFAISNELSAKLRALGSAPNQMPGITLLELAQYGATTMRYRIPWIAAHTNVDRVLQKTARFIGGDVHQGSVTLFVDRDGRRMLAVDAIFYRPKYPDKLDAAQVFFVGPNRIQTPAPVLPDTGWLGLFFVTSEALKTDAAKNATGLVVKLSGNPILEVALDGDFAKREAFFEAWETAIEKYQALLPPTPPTDYGEPNPDDMVEALLNNSGIVLSEFIEWARDPTRAVRCGVGAGGSRDSMELLRKCVKIQKTRCTGSESGHTCDYVAILGIEGLQRAEKPGRGSFYRNENGFWLVENIRPGNP
jgi:hypothetical protein